MNHKNKTILGKAALFGSALIWGSSFFINKKHTKKLIIR